MDAVIKNTLEQLNIEAEDVSDELALASHKEATYDEIDHVKDMMEKLIKNYYGLLKQLEPGEKLEVKSSLGLNVDRLKNLVEALE